MPGEGRTFFVRLRRHLCSSPLQELCKNIVSSRFLSLLDRKILLTHGPIVPLRTEEPMHENDGWPRRATRAFMAVVGQRQVLCSWDLRRKSTTTRAIRRYNSAHRHAHWPSNANWASSRGSFYYGWKLYAWRCLSKFEVTKNLVL